MNVAEALNVCFILKLAGKTDVDNENEYIIYFIIFLVKLIWVTLKPLLHVGV